VLKPPSALFNKRRKVIPYKPQSKLILNSKVLIFKERTDRSSIWRKSNFSVHLKRIQNEA